MVMALPIKMLKGLRITIKEKIGVALIFSIGHVIIIFAILRVNELYISLSEADPNINVTMSMWSVLEAAIGKCSTAFNLGFSLLIIAAVIVGTLPSLRSLIKKKSQHSDASLGSRGPYIRSGESAMKSSRSSRAPGATIYALQDMRGAKQSGPRDSKEILASPTVDKSGHGITVTRDVEVHSGEQLALRGEVSIESFIHSK